MNMNKKFFFLRNNLIREKEFLIIINRNEFKKSRI